MRNISIEKSILDQRYRFLKLDTISIEFNMEALPEMHEKENYLREYLMAKCPKISEIIHEQFDAGLSEYSYAQGQIEPFVLSIFRSPNIESLQFAISDSKWRRSGGVWFDSI